ncbi:MAG: FAD-dependent monooxygenase [Archangiaceae bacterium]|nr:FAD-dependent monooxygenase [Archangiaceae bacterium]
MTTFDAVVAGGSFAGACAAAALSRAGMRVLVCEPGLADHRRLAGELIQAPGAHALSQLGLLDTAWAAGAVPSCGFAVLPGGAAPPLILSYGEAAGCPSTGIALEHSTLAAALLDHVRHLPRVTVVSDRVFRATGLEARTVHVELASGARLDAELLVAADGRASKLRHAAGIATTTGERVRMLGVRVRGPLPHEGYGHVALGGDAPVLAYRISRDAVRVLFTAVDPHAHPFEADVHALGEPLSSQVRAALAEQRSTSAVVWALTPRRSSHGRLFLAGDAGGCVHPLTATGVSFCANDALRLEHALRDARGDVLAASARYHLSREAPLLTRSMLGPLLAQTLADPRPATRALRQGLLRYWRRDRAGRAASMGLLSTHEPRLEVLAREYVKVMGHALLDIAGRDAPVHTRLGLSARMLREGGRLALRALGVARGSHQPTTDHPSDSFPPGAAGGDAPMTVHTAKGAS